MICERIDAVTPAGGAYSEIHYFDKNDNPVEKNVASKAIIRECMSNGSLLCETFMDLTVSGKHEFSYENSYEICPVCDWENEEYQIKYPDEEDGPNGMSLNAYKAEWEKKINTDVSI